MVEELGQLSEGPGEPQRWKMTRKEQTEWVEFQKKNWLGQQ